MVSDPVLDPTRPKSSYFTGSGFTSLCYFGLPFTAIFRLGAFQCFFCVKPHFIAVRVTGCPRRVTWRRCWWKLCVSWQSRREATSEPSRSSCKLSTRLKWNRYLTLSVYLRDWSGTVTWPFLYIYEIEVEQVLDPYCIFTRLKWNRYLTLSVYLRDWSGTGTWPVPYIIHCTSTNWLFYPHFRVRTQLNPHPDVPHLVKPQGGFMYQIEFADPHHLDADPDPTYYFHVDPAPDF